MGITGASGAPYARTLLQSLPVHEVCVHLVTSSAGRLVYELETGQAIERELPQNAKLYSEKDFTAPFASGSFPTMGMVIVPCSMGSLGAIANGISQNLIHRAADVCLKEKRPLVIVPRETPLNTIHLKNMLSLAEAGATILPPMPGFYHLPQTKDDLVNFVVARIMDQFKIPHSLTAPWNPDAVKIPGREN